MSHSVEQAEPSETALLVANELTGSRGENRLFHNLNLTLNSGDALRITGPNGSGKTTLLRILSGLGQVEAGAVTLMGAQNIAEHRQAVFYIGHNLGLNLRLNAIENLMWWLNLHGEKAFLHSQSNSSCLQMCEEALAKAGIYEQQVLSCANLSAGQKRRSVLARLFLPEACIGYKRIWLLDEPLTSLDADFSARLIQHIQLHRQLGGAVILTTHQDVPEMDLEVLDLTDFA